MSPNLKVYEEVTARILAELEQGTAPWRQPWKTSAPISLDGRRYRGINVLLLQLVADAHGYGDHRWGTFNAVKRAGGHVRRGEKATQVILWKPAHKFTRDDDGGTVLHQYMLLRTYAVFNATQCEGL